MHDVDNLPDGREPPETERKPKQADELLGLASEAELFRTSDERVFATVPVGGHLENLPVYSRAFKSWLKQKYYLLTGGAPSAQAFQDALGVIESRALYEGRLETIAVRIAGSDKGIFLDLCDPEWRVVEITATGWQMIDASPVRFLRRGGMLALPVPERGGDLGQLRRFVNVGVDRDESWVLLLAWLMAAFRPTGPYPILGLNGEQGSAKSTTSRVLRALVDPNKASLRAEPKSLHDLAISADNSWLVCLDNLSPVSPRLSDALCRLSTGGGFSTRELYSDDEERIFEAQRPLILNGISEVATRPDLLDRTLGVCLPSIDKKNRRDEKTFWAEFEEARPRILGALFDCLAIGLRNLPGVKLDEPERLADFHRWSLACEPAFGALKVDFSDAFRGSRTDANAIALEASPLAPEIHRLLERVSDPWESTASELLEELNTEALEDVKKRKAWPSGPPQLGAALRRIAPPLRGEGVFVEFHRGNDRPGRQRLIRIYKA